MAVIWPLSVTFSLPKIVKLFRNPKIRWALDPMSKKDESPVAFQARKSFLKNSLEREYGLQHRFLSNVLVIVSINLSMQLYLLGSKLLSDKEEVDHPSFLLYSYLMNSIVVAYSIIEEKVESLSGSEFTPNGTSPLYDAYCNAVMPPLKRLKYRPSGVTRASSEFAKKGIDLVPDELMITLLSFLSPKDIEIFGRTSKKNNMDTKVEHLWKELNERYFSQLLTMHPKLRTIIQSDALIRTQNQHRKILQFFFKNLRNEYNRLLARQGLNTIIWQGDPTHRIVLGDIFDQESLREFRSMALDFTNLVINNANRANINHTEIQEDDPYRVNNEIYTFGDALEFCFESQEYFDQINTLLVRCFIEYAKRNHPDNRTLNLSSVITRLTNKSVDLLLKFNPVRLHLRNCFLFAVPNRLFQLSNLEQLDLSANLLSNLPLEGQKLNALEELDIGTNLLSTLPLELFSLRKLRLLQLGNYAPAITTCYCCRDPIGVKTTGNNFESFPVQFSSLQNLEQLSIRSLGLTTIPKPIFQLRRLQLLDASHNEISRIPKEAIQLPVLEDNSLYVFGNPVVKWLPWFKIKGEISSKIFVVNQMYYHYAFSKPSLSLRKAANTAARGLCWMYSKIPMKEYVVPAAAIALSAYAYGKPTQRT